MKKYAKHATLVLIGFVLGVVFMGYLSMRASSVLMDIVRINYITEQKILGIQAEKAKDYNKAVVNFNNVVSATSLPGLYSFSKDKKYWTFFFPFSALVLKRIQSSTGAPHTQRVIDTGVGIERGILANALELAGRHKEAEEELSAASSLLGHNDVEQTRRFIKDIIEVQEDLLEVQDQYTYSK
jgi:hypothetical protein